MTCLRATREADGEIGREGAAELLASERERGNDERRVGWMIVREEGGLDGNAGMA
jgi:hypothetical protein